MHSFLVLGSEGFIGKSVTSSLRLLTDNVVTVDSLGDPDYKLDLLNDFEEFSTLVHDIKPHFVLNFAALSNSKMCLNSPLSVYPLNVLFVDKLSELCIRSKVKCLFHSSSEWVYGNGPVFEDTCPLPYELYSRNLDLYSRSKLDSEILLFRRSCSQHSTYFVAYRFGIIYGNNISKSNCVIDYLLNQHSMGLSLSVNSPFASRSFVSLDDIISLFDYSDSVYSGLVSPFSCFNIQGQSSYTLKSIIDCINGSLTALTPLTKDDIVSSLNDSKSISSDIPRLLHRDPSSLFDYIQSCTQSLH